MAGIRNTTRSKLWNLQRRYNNKITRLLKNEKIKNLLPNKITDTEIINIINTSSSRDINRLMGELSRFTSRKGAKVINYQGEEMLLATKQNLISMKRSAVMRLNNELKMHVNEIFRGDPEQKQKVSKLLQQFKDYPNTAKFYGTNINTVARKLENIRTNPFNYNATTRYNIYKAYASDMKGWRTFKENYIEMVRDTGYLYGIPNEEVHDITARLQKMGDNEFRQMYYESTVFEQFVQSYHEYMEFEVDELLANPDNHISYNEDWFNLRGLIMEAPEHI